MRSNFNSAKLRLCAAIIIALTLTTTSTANASLQSFLTQRLASVYSRVQQILASHGIHLPTNQTTTGGSSTVTTIGSSSGLTKLGSGTLTLGGANTYSGSTTVTGGTLTVSGSTTLNSGTTNISLRANTNQYGSGTISGAGTITFANPGTLDLNGYNTNAGVMTLSSLTLQGGANIRYDLDTSNSGTAHFLTNPNTSNYLGVFNTVGSGTLIQSGASSSTFQNVTVNGASYQLLTYAGQSGGIQLTNLNAAIPEPGSLVLASCGFAALFLARRRFLSKR